jgi:hypothetical protein
MKSDPLFLFSAEDNMITMPDYYVLKAVFFTADKILFKYQFPFYRHIFKHSC